MLHQQEDCLLLTVLSKYHVKPYKFSCSFGISCTANHIPITSWKSLFLCNGELLDVLTVFKEKKSYFRLVSSV